jgi:site-specific DNA recombinase
LIDSYTEGLIDKAEFEPRLTRLRERLGLLETQVQQARDEASLEAELTLMLSRLEEFADQVKAGLHAADWLTRREIIRALVKRVEITLDQVRVVFRVGPHTPQPSSDKGFPSVPPQSLQHCRRSDHPALRRSLVSGAEFLAFHNSSFEPGPAGPPHRWVGCQLIQ